MEEERDGNQKEKKIVQLKIVPLAILLDGH